MHKSNIKVENAVCSLKKILGILKGVRLNLPIKKLDRIISSTKNNNKPGLERAHNEIIKYQLEIIIKQNT